MAKLNPALEAHYNSLALSGVAERENPRPKGAKMKQSAGAERRYSQLADQIAEQTGQFK